MFDFGFTELMLVAVVALIVVGPQRLPKVARTAGHLLGRLQRYVSDVKSDISREMQLEDLKKLQQQVQEQARDLESSVRKQVDQVGSDLDKTTSELNAALAPDAANKHDTLPRSGPPMPEHRAPVSESQPDATVAAPSDQATPDADRIPEGPQMELGLDREAAAKQSDDKR